MLCSTSPRIGNGSCLVHPSSTRWHDFHSFHAPKSHPLGNPSTHRLRNHLLHLPGLFSPEMVRTLPSSTCHPPSSSPSTPFLPSPWIQNLRWHSTRNFHHRQTRLPSQPQTCQLRRNSRNLRGPENRWPPRLNSPHITKQSQLYLQSRSHNPFKWLASGAARLPHYSLPLLPSIRLPSPSFHYRFSSS